jgi:transposase
MAQAHPIARLGGWKGYEVSAQWTELRAGRSWCVIRLEPLRGHERCCSRCGRLTPAIHDLEERRIRDLPLFEHWVEQRVLRVRVECPTCGPKLERLAWLAAYARETHRLAESVARFCKVMALRHVASYFGLDWKTVKEIDRANEPHDDRLGRKVVKGARRLLLKNRDSLRPGENVQLQELLAANHQLFVVYVLRDALKELWRHREPQAALRAWHGWYHQALRGAIPPLIRLAQRLRPFLPGILARCCWPLGTDLVEGINNRIKVIKRMACPGVGR